MSQFQRTAPKTGMATFYKVPVANGGRVTVPVTDPLALSRMVVLEVFEQPAAGVQEVELLTTGLMAGAEYHVHLRAHVAVGAGRSLTLVWDTDSEFYTFDFSNLTAGQEMWVKVRHTPGVPGQGFEVLATCDAAGETVYYTTPDGGVAASQAWVQQNYCVKVTTSDMNVTSNVTLANIPGLSATLEPGTYSIRGALHFQCVGSGGFRVGAAGTAVCSLVLLDMTATRTENQSMSALGAGRIAGSTLTNALGTAILPSAGAGGLIMVNGTLVVTTTGSVQLQFAQGSSNATASRIMAGSTLTITKLP